MRIIKLIIYLLRNDVIIRTGAASAVGARRHDENDVVVMLLSISIIFWTYYLWSVPNNGLHIH